VLRLSLAPSAVADVAAGLFIGHWGVLPAFSQIGPLLAASACVYHGGMALNDWADRDQDARTRPERPIPSGALRATHVGAVGVVLLLVAVGFAALVSLPAAAWTAGIAALVLAYDFGPRGAWSGPFLLGACRAANLAFGLLHASTLSEHAAGILPRAWFALPLLYGAYVFCASKVARLEDRPDDSSSGAGARVYAWLTALLLFAPALVDVHAPTAVELDFAALALAAAASWSLLRTAWTTREWTRAACGRFTGLALRRLLLFTALAVLSHRAGTREGWILALAILAGFPVSAALRRVFPPT
jgi:4-hydroxybenzoate polyprenyltransferase